MYGSNGFDGQHLSQDHSPSRVSARKGPEKLASVRKRRKAMDDLIEWQKEEHVREQAQNDEI